MVTKKVWLIIGLLLSFVGLLIFGIALCASGFNFKNLNGKRYDEYIYSIEENFDSIKIDSKEQNINIVYSDDNVNKVIFYDKEDYGSFNVTEGTLYITNNYVKKWYENIFDFTESKITVVLSKNEYKKLAISNSTGDIMLCKEIKFEEAEINLSTGDIKCLSNEIDNLTIVGSTGDVEIKELSSSMIKVKLTTGDIELSSVESKNSIDLYNSTGEIELNNVITTTLNIDGTTGDVDLNNLIALDRININRSTGDVEFEKIDASIINIKTKTGDIIGSVLSEKKFNVSSKTGKVSVPKSETGGEFEANASTGDIIIRIKK